MASYAEREWANHSARMERIRRASLMGVYQKERNAQFDMRVPDPSLIGPMADAVISDEVAVSASADVCMMFGIDLYEDDDKEG